MTKYEQEQIKLIEKNILFAIDKTYEKFIAYKEAPLLDSKVRAQGEGYAKGFYEGKLQGLNIALVIFKSILSKK